MATIQHGKGEKRRIAKDPDDVLRCIQEYLEAAGRQNTAPSAPLFVGFRKGDHPTVQGISDKEIERTVAACGAALGMKLTSHDLRATFITLALEGGAVLHQCSMPLGMPARSRLSAIINASSIWMIMPSIMCDCEELRGHC